MPVERGSCPVCGAPLPSKRAKYCSRACVSRARQHYKICKACGRAFPSPPSDKTVTCSPACFRAYAVVRNTGKSSDWSPGARARASQRGQTPNLLMGTPAAQESPKSGRFDTNINAKEWELLSPGGDRYRLRNLKNWIRGHRDLLGTAEGDHAAALAYKGFQHVRRRDTASWHGWTILSVKNSPEG